MLIVGAGGMATQIFPDLVFMNLQDIAFWSETNTRYTFIGEKYPILQTDNEVTRFFQSTSRSYLLCVGSGPHRRGLEEKFNALGGNLVTYVSPLSTVSPYGSELGTGTIVMSHVIIEPGVRTGRACIFNKTSNVGHGCSIGAYTELAPGVILTGEVSIGDNCYVGTRAIILPGVSIGHNSVIAAGSVVRKDVPDNALVAGEFAKVIRTSPSA
jgi:UDP-perosamine 4-acetyltransferase